METLVVTARYLHIGSVSFTPVSSGLFCKITNSIIKYKFFSHCFVQQWLCTCNYHRIPRATDRTPFLFAHTRLSCLLRWSLPPDLYGGGDVYVVLERPEIATLFASVLGQWRERGRGTEEAVLSRLHRGIPPSTWFRRFFKIPSGLFFPLPPVPQTRHFGFFLKFSG
jgi:hypothetical protein